MPHTTVKNRIVIMSELAYEMSVIEGIAFEDCTLIGPIALALLGNSPIRGCNFDGASVNGIFVAVPEDEPITWALGLRDCPITRCKLSRVGIIGSPAQVAKWKVTFGQADPGRP